MSSLEGILNKDENVIFNDVQETKNLRTIFVVALIFAVCSFFYDEMIGIFAVLAWWGFLYHYAQRGAVITDRRIIKVKGIFSVSFDEMRLTQIESINTKNNQVIISGSGNNKIIFSYDYKKSDFKSKLDEALDSHK